MHEARGAKKPHVLKGRAPAWFDIEAT